MTFCPVSWRNKSPTHDLVLPVIFLNGSGLESVLNLTFNTTIHFTSFLTVSVTPGAPIQERPILTIIQVYET